MDTKRYGEVGTCYIGCAMTEQDPSLQLKIMNVPIQLIDDFLRKNSKISTKSNQQGLQYALEEYVHDIKVSSNKIEARVYHSQRKREKPHLLQVNFMGNSITGQECSCIAG